MGGATGVCISLRLTTTTIAGIKEHGDTSVRRNGEFLVVYYGEGTQSARVGQCIILIGFRWEIIFACAAVGNKVGVQNRS